MVKVSFADNPAKRANLPQVSGSTQLPATHKTVTIGAMRVLIADRRTEVRAALALLLGQEPGVEVGGEAHDSAELLCLMEIVRPDVVLLEWGLPGRPIASLVAILHALSWTPRVLVLALREETLGAALAAGADAFASKDQSPERLVAALRALQVEGDRNEREPPIPAGEPLDFSPKRTDE